MRSRESVDAVGLRERSRKRSSGLVLAAALAACAAPGATWAQEKPAPAKAEGIFDAEKPAAKDKTKAIEKEGPTPKAKAAATREKEKEKDKGSGISDRDSIGFTQENVAAQMTELEERMFRLSEALRSLEPENASRLRLALKFSREELILQQMKETRKLMQDAQVNKAETEVRELLAKLEHLRNLLLAEDLDFQMKLARLRQMREALGQLDRIIKEERRELAWSRQAVDEQNERQQLPGRRADLEALVRDQKAVIDDTRQAGRDARDPARKDRNKDKDARTALRRREDGVRTRAAGLAADPLLSGLQPAYLKQADPHLGDAGTLLGAADLDPAAASEGRALDLFQKELDRLNERIARTEKDLAAAEFQRFEQDQARNRGATDALAAVSARLGNSGVSLQKDLIRAGGSMQAAEGDLAKTAAEAAAGDQLAALKHLVKARDDLAGAVEGLLVELRSELQTRIVAELTEMHDLQTSIRETTEAQAPRIAQRSRTAMILVVGLAQKEAELAERTEHLLALVEETEFGIALPTALRVLSREMRTIQGWLKEGDASSRTVTLEKRVEDDLLGLLEAMRRLPPTTPPPPGSPLPSDLRARERELNRLIAELKMVRLLQSRLNDDTVGLDQSRPKAPPLTAALRREIETLKAGQDEIRDSLGKISGRLEPPEEPAQNPVLDMKLKLDKFGK